MANVTAFFRFVTDLFERAPAAVRGLNSWDYGLAQRDFTYNADTDPNATEVWSGTTALSAGTVTVNFGTLARTGRTALNLTGLTIYAIRIKNNGANPMTFKDGATNGYPLFGLTDGHVIGAGDEFMQATSRVAGFATVATADITIDVTGTGAQTFDMAIVAGTP